MAGQKTKPARMETGRPPRAAPRRAATSPHQRARRDRGAETRAQLIEAALDVFGRLGYEGASTREIAKAANANLAAIVYHFGGKEALHIAVAEHVAASIASRMGSTLAVATDPTTVATPAAARAALDRLIDNFIEVILGSAEAERWARFIIREQMQPTAAFDVIYRILGGAAETGARLIATVLGRPLSDEIRLRVFTLMGQVLVFRVGQTLVLRRMGWRSIGDRQRDDIKRVVHENVSAILERSSP